MGVRISSRYGAHLLDLELHWVYIIGNTIPMPTHDCDKYRPQIKFDFDEMQTSGEQTFIDKDTVYPGEEVKAAIRLAGVIYFRGRLAEGMLFEFLEGPRVIGTGKILEILNDTLKIDH